jgi:hypothetical protein
MIPNFINAFGIIVDQNKGFAQGKQTFYLLIDMVTFADRVKDRGNVPRLLQAGVYGRKPDPLTTGGNAHTLTVPNAGYVL